MTGIYAIITPSKKAYIGSSTNIASRWRNHLSLLRRNKHHCLALQSGYAKHGEKGLQFVVLERCCKEIIIEREQWWIDHANQFWPKILNSSKIAGRPDITPEIRAIIAEKKRGSKASDATRQRMRESRAGYKHSEETLRKLKESAQRRGISDETKAKMKAARQAKTATRIAAIPLGPRGKMTGQALINNRAGAVKRALAAHMAMVDWILSA